MDRVPDPSRPELTDRTSDLWRPDYWRVTRGGFDVSAEGIANPSTVPYRVVCWTYCGREQATLDLHVKASMPMPKFIERARIAASVQHHKQNGCQECPAVMRAHLTPSEKTFIYAGNPSLGKILGLEE